MKIEREIFDNGKKIVHISYSNKDIQKIISENQKYMKERELEKSQAEESIELHDVETEE